MNIDYFYSLTDREFTNTLNGYRKREDNLSKERWMMTGKIMWAAAMPHLKSESGEPLKETDLIAFPWQTELIKEFTQADGELLEKEAEAVKEFYRLRDEKKLKNNALS